MKHRIRLASQVMCILLLLLSLPLPVSATDGPAYYDCLLQVYGVDAAAENIVSACVGVQVQAGDGSGDIWAVTSYAVTAGAAYYAVADAKDADSNTVAELIASDADSGIAVFRMDSRIGSCTAPALATLNGISTENVLAVAGLGKKEDANYFFSRAVRITDLTTQNGYTVLSLADGGDASLREYEVYPIGALMTNTNEIIGFYTGNYCALPAGYIMPSEDGIGTLDAGNGNGEQNTPSGGDKGDTADGGASGAPEDSPGSLPFSTVEKPSDVKELVNQAKAERRQAAMFHAILIVAAVAAAGGIIAFALLKSRKSRATVAAARPDPALIPPQPMGKTEYVGSQEYGKTEPALPCFYIVPLPGTPGVPREVPAQGLTFGRDPTCNVVFPPDTSGVSGRHCKLSWNGGTLCLTDLGSSFGTLLEDGRRLSDSAEEVAAGTRFYLGSRKIGFTIEDIGCGGSMERKGETL